MLVTATDNEHGGLYLEITYPDGTPTFKNSYTKPADDPVTPPSTPSTPTTPPTPPSSIPETGDTSSTGLALGIAGVMTALAGALLFLRRRLA